MAVSPKPAPRVVQADLNYFRAFDEHPPYQYVYDPPTGTAKENLGVEAYPVEIHDIRSNESTSSLDENGFQFVKNASVESDFEDEGRIRTLYYRDVEEMVKRETGAKRVHIFDHTIRSKGVETGQRSPHRGPVERVHVDQTFDAAIRRVRHELPNEADELLRGRVQIINVWRPIHHTVAHKPLAVCDWQSLDIGRDLVPVRLIYPDRESSTFSVRYNPHHVWYFMSDQTPMEVTFIKCYDSEVGKARLTPHTAFLDTSSPPDAPQRHSIEVRCLVFGSK